MNMSISGIQSSGIGMTSISADMRAPAAIAPSHGSTVVLGDGIDLQHHGQLDLDQIIMSKGGGKQSKTVTNKPSQAPIIE